MATLSWGTGISLVGPKGTPGVSVLTGNGSPTMTNTTGVDGQAYIDTLNGAVYQNVGGTWGTGQSLVGPMGINGVSGAFFTGTGAPTSATNASNPDANAIYIQTTGEVWTYTKSGGWVDSGETLVGPAGAPGTPGAPGAPGADGLRGTQTYRGTDVPSASNTPQAQAGDYYYQINSAGTAIQLYQLTSS
jgi:hypothetical protein